MDFKSGLKQAEKQMLEISQKISVPRSYLPTFGYSRDMGYPHIERDSNGFHYIVVERGKEHKRVTESNFDNLLYVIFKPATSHMAFDYEYWNRKRNQDGRRLAFAKQLELLETLNPEWKLKCEKDINDILNEHPYNDQLRGETSLTEELVDVSIKLFNLLTFWRKKQ